MRVELRGEAFEPYRELAEFERDTLGPGSYGAASCFVGSMRDFNQGDEVAEMELEHYPGMTERFLERIAGEALQHWDVIDVLVMHRHGRVAPGDPIVLIAVWSAHRSAAFEACRFIIEELKHKAPFWKRESVGEGARWVDGNTQV